MDTIGSACALASAVGPAARACGIHVGRVASRILDGSESQFMLMTPSRIHWPRKLGGIVVVDSAGPTQIGINLPTGIPLCVIDHHLSGEDWELKDGDLELRWSTDSTTMMIQDWIELCRPHAMNADIARLLLAGLITDTGRFKHGQAASIAAAHRLLHSTEVDYPRLVEALESIELNDSTRIAIAKALSRTESQRAGPWFLLLTSTGTHEGQVCHTLLTAGAEVSMAFRTSNDGDRISARATQTACREGMNLGLVMQKLAQQLGGEGGGHAGAAGWNGSCERVAVCSAFIAIISAIQRKEA
jgi:nanoRNase/pAp phosphatase (c-di-AMP/oligoRNAs hydrolase)